MLVSCCSQTPGPLSKEPAGATHGALGLATEGRSLASPIPTQPTVSAAPRGLIQPSWPQPWREARVEVPHGSLTGQA